MTATVRVFVPTYRRPHLLARALASLRAQNFGDWVCEVHNDDPTDPGPGRIVAELRDARIQCIDHPRNLGAPATFNLVFRPASEEFVSMLEDDNWWEPRFLETMVAAAGEHPEVAFFWSNMRIWQEMPDGSFEETGACVSPRDGNQPRIRLLEWASKKQMLGAAHSNSAALLRSAAQLDLQIPDVPPAATEMFRERCMPHPLGFISEPLANFSRTRSSVRSNDRAEWAEVQAMLATTFLKHANLTDTDVAMLMKEQRQFVPPRTAALLLAALLEPECRRFLRAATAGDLIALAAGLIRHPGVLVRLIASRHRHAHWWEFLDRHTARRFATAKSGSTPFVDTTSWLG